MNDEMAKEENPNERKALEQGRQTETPSRKILD